jgi:hypothetical protein
MQTPASKNPGAPTGFGIWSWAAVIVSILINRQLAPLAAFMGARMALAAAKIPETAVMQDGATAYVNALSSVPEWSKAAVIIGAVAAFISVFVVRSSIRRGWLAALVVVVIGCIVGAVVGFVQGYSWHPF